MKLFLILHFIGLSAGVGTSLFMSLLSMRMRGAGDTEQATVYQHAFKASILGEIGLVLMIISGLAMAALNPAFIEMELFKSKMVMVALLTVFLAMLRNTGARMLRGEAALAKKIPFLSRMVLLLSLITTVIAVLAFG